MPDERGSPTFGFIVGVLTACSLAAGTIAIAGYKLADRSYLVKIEKPAENSIRPRVIVMRYENRYVAAPHDCTEEVELALRLTGFRGTVKTESFDTDTRTATTTGCRYKVPGRDPKVCLEITGNVYNEAWLKCRDGYYIN